MLNDISKYKYIRDTILYTEDNKPRVELDANVLGTRKQKAIQRLVDLFYLTELSSIHGTVQQNSVETTGWPVSFRNEYPMKLPEPNLEQFFAYDRISEITLPTSDIFDFRGGYDPDLEKLRKKYQDENEQLAKDLTELNDTYTTEVEQLKEEYDAKMTQYRESEEDVIENYKNINKYYEEELNEAEKQFNEEFTDIQKEIGELDEKLEGKVIDKATWNNERQKLEVQKYQSILNYFTSVQGAVQKRNHSEINRADALNTIYVDRDADTREYKKNLTDKKDKLDEDVEKRNKQHKEKSNEIYMSANGSVGLGYQENKEKMEKQLNDIKLYDARKNLDKSIKWATNWEWFTEYNDRLYADWEKCKYREVSGELIKVQNGYQEDYTGRATYQDKETEWGTLPGYTITDSFSRFIEGDTVNLSKHYENDQEGASESSTFSFSYDYKIMVGNRHQMNNIQAVHILGRIYGFGEGDGGSKSWGNYYDVISCSRSGVSQEKYVKRYDDEQDLHLQNMQKIDDDYHKEKAELDFKLSEDLVELELKMNDDILKLEHELSKSIRNITGNTIQGISETIIQANTKKFNGEDNTAELKEISDKKSELYENITNLRLKFYEDRDEIRNKFDVDKAQLNSTYSTDLEDLSEDRKDKINDEDDRSSKVLQQIDDDYNDEREQYLEDAENERDDAEAAADEALQNFYDQSDEAKENKNKELVGKWNNKFPNVKLEDDYNILDNGAPIDSLESDEQRQWAFDEITLPGYNWQVSQYQPTTTAVNKWESAYAKAAKEYVKKIAEFEVFNKDKREIWTFDVSNFATFADQFSDQERSEYKSAWGEKGAYNFEPLKIWIQTNYQAETGNEYPDYYELDNPDEKDDDNTNTNQ